MESKTHKYSMNHDMRSLYVRLYEKYDDGYPEFVLLDELENNQDISHVCMGNGNRIICLKDNNDDVLYELLCNEIDKPSCGSSSLSLPFHELSNKEISKWCRYACYIADCLDIELKQMLFVHGFEISGYAGVLPTLIVDDMCMPEMLVNIAHELRHAWQHVNHPDWFDSYIRPEDDEKAYEAQIAEVDAEAFGIKVESLIMGVDFMESSIASEWEPEYYYAIKDQMDKIDVVISNKKIKEIRRLIDLEGVLKSIQNAD